MGAGDESGVSVDRDDDDDRGGDVRCSRARYFAGGMGDSAGVVSREAIDGVKVEREEEDRCRGGVEPCREGAQQPTCYTSTTPFSGVGAVIPDWRDLGVSHRIIRIDRVLDSSGLFCLL